MVDFAKFKEDKKNGNVYVNACLVTHFKRLTDTVSRIYFSDQSNVDVVCAETEILEELRKAS